MRQAGGGEGVEAPGVHGAANCVWIARGFFAMEIALGALSGAASGAWGAGREPWWRRGAHRAAEGGARKGISQSARLRAAAGGAVTGACIGAVSVRAHEVLADGAGVPRQGVGAGAGYGRAVGPSHWFYLAAGGEKKAKARDIDFASIEARHFDAANSAEMRDLFSLIDVDGSGALSADEVLSAMKVLNLPRTDDWISALTSARGASGTLDADAFVEFMYQTEMRVQGIFDDLDEDLSGKVTVEEMEIGLKKVGINLTTAEANQLISEADIDGDGNLSYPEFRAYFARFTEIVNERRSTDAWLREASETMNSKFGGGAPSVHLKKPSKGALFTIAVIAAAALGSRILVAPLEIMSLESMVGGSQVTSVAAFGEIARRMAKEGRLFKGNSITIVNTAPCAALRYVFYDKAKLAILAITKSEHLNPFGHLVSGSFGGMASLFILYPLEVTQTMMRAQPAIYKNPALTLVSLVKTRKFDIYRGILPAFVSMLPHVFLEYNIRSGLEGVWRATTGSTREPSSELGLFMSTVSGMIAQCIGHPLLVVRTRMQVGSLAAAGSAGALSPMMSAAPKGWITVTERIVRDEGVGALYRGLTPTLLQRVVLGVFTQTQARVKKVATAEALIMTKETTTRMARELEKSSGNEDEGGKGLAKFRRMASRKMRKFVDEKGRRDEEA